VNQSLEISHSIGNSWAAAVAVLTVTFANMERGDFGAAIASAKEGEELATIAGFTGIFGFTGVVRGIMFAAVGANEQAVEAASVAIERSVGTPWAAASGTTGRLQIDFYSGTNAIPDEEIFTMLETMATQKSNRYLQAMYTVACEALYARGFYDRVIQLADQTIALKAERSIILGAPDMYLMKGKSLLHLGRKEEAVAAFQRGVAICEEFGLRFSFGWLCAELGAIEVADGDTAAGEAHLAEAREILEFIANHTGSEAREVSFRALPTVKAILDT
jgi:tetratricopeptide (TPR) repeat protein